MAVTANYETVMIISMKKGEEGIQVLMIVGATYHQIGNPRRISS